MIHFIYLAIRATIKLNEPMMMTDYMTQHSPSLLTHEPHDIVAELDLDSYRQRLQAKDPSTLALPLDVTLDLLQQLSEFDLGRWLLAHKGLNGYWYSYVHLYLHDSANLHPLERWFLKSCPALLSARERFQNTQRVLQENLQSDMQIASIPCCCMDDLLSLNYGGLSNITLTGIDLDDHALAASKRNAVRYGRNNCQFIKKDAWHLQSPSCYDIIKSNGLNNYQPDNQLVVALYREFYEALKPGGLLLSGFITPPPNLSSESPWKNYNPADVLKQKAILSDIVGVRWRSFRTEQQTKAQLEAAGLQVMDIIHDFQSMNLAVVSRRPR